MHTLRVFDIMFAIVGVARSVVLYKEGAIEWSVVCNN